MSNPINDIAHYYNGVGYGFKYNEYTTAEKSVVLEEALISICDNLAEIEKITGHRKVNVEYLLSLVGSYVIGLQEGTISIDEVDAPRVLFEESLFPSLDNPETIKKEDIVDEDNSGSDSTALIGHDSNEPAD